MNHVTESFPAASATRLRESIGRAKWLGVGLLGCALAMPLQASADEGYKLNYSPAQLTTNTSVQALHKRIRQLAREACPSYFVERDLRARAECIAAVEDELVTKVNNPRLTAVHLGKPLEALASN